MTTKKYILFLFALLTFSCEKDLELETQGNGGRLVLYSFIAPDSLFQVHLSKSVSHISVDDFERVYDGNVTVYKNNNIVDDFIFPFDKSWTNRQGIKVSSGDTVLIEAADGRGQRIWGETVIPPVVSVDVADTLVELRNEKRNGEEKVLTCRLSIPDPVDVENYYQLIILEEICRVENEKMVCERSRVEYDKSDPVFFVQDKDGSLIGEIDFDGCFSDELFDGTEYTLEVNLPVEYASVPERSGASRKIYFLLLSHTRGFYDYYRSRVVAEYGYNLPIIDPVRIYNNINGGLGLVSGYSVASDSLVFNK